MNETTYVIVRLAQRYDRLEGQACGGEVKYDTGAYAKSGTGVVVRFHEAAPVALNREKCLHEATA